MKTHFEKDLEHTYLVFDSYEIHEHEYTLQMLLRCSLPSVLPASISLRDGNCCLRMEVTACTSLSSRFQNAPLTGEHVRRILRAVRDLAARLPAYLLDPRDIYLDPDVIFFGPEHDEVLLCFVPHLTDREPETIKLLADFFLKKIDHSDTVASHLAYGLFNMVAGDGYIIGSVISGLLESSVDAYEHFPDHDGERPYSSFVGKMPPPSGRAPSGLPQARKKVSYVSAAKHNKFRRFLPALFICCGAVFIILLFGLDMTQAIGMGFMCAALVWMVNNAAERRRSDVKNIWADENDSGDDEFYKSLLREVYAESNEDNCKENRETAPNADSTFPALISLQRDICPDIVISSAHLLIGKSARSADAVIPDPAVSRTHARIEQRTDGYYVTDLYSTNGTLLDGNRLNPGQAYLLRDGALLTLASLKYKVSLPRAQC